MTVHDLPATGQLSWLVLFIFQDVFTAGGERLEEKGDVVNVNYFPVCKFN